MAGIKTDHTQTYIEWSFAIHAALLALALNLKCGSACTESNMVSIPHMLIENML